MKTLWIFVVSDLDDLELYRGCKYIRKLIVSNNRLVKIPENGFQILISLQTLILKDNGISSPVFGPRLGSLEVRKC